jgi:hypothetical protein
MNFVYYTKQFARELALDGKKDAIEKKLQDIAKVSNVENLKSIDKYRKGILVLKFQRSNTCRIIIQPDTIQVEDRVVSVLFVRSFVEKRGFDYFWGSVIHPQLTSGEWLKQNPLPREDREACIREYIQQEAKEIQVRMELPPRLADWMASFKVSLDFQIYERESWVTFSNDRSPLGLHDQNINIFRETLKTIVGKTSNPDVLIETINSETYVKSAIDSRHNIGIIYSDFPDIEGKRVFVLQHGAHTKLQKDQWEKALIEAAGEEGRLTADLESISKDAFRAYPTWILNEVLWAAIQRHEGSHNLSLLPEQVHFLKGFKFPTYISGQAGSGKSTMLYYLFANAFFYQNSGELKGDIIFLTENDYLLERTKQSVVGLLTSNPEFDVRHDVQTLNQIRDNFQSFRDFLLGFLPEGEKESFDPNNYLDFPRFKTLYSKTFRMKRSAEEAWFVLTTYVLGYFEDQIIDTVEKYKDDKSGIPRDFRIIDDEDFKEIVSEALPLYNKLISEGYWDKIQLVRAIRSFYPNSLPKHYTVVFCDEAQDFSRIELRLIIQSSEYTNYDLSNAKQIPIVFAGDALQTVNPTGFSEDRLHQMYFEAFKEAGFHYDKKESTYIPKYNYRSVESIVRLANIVQNFRRESLKEDAFIKQTAKRIGALSQFPMLHDKAWLLKPENRVVYESKFKHKSFIVPVDLHEDSTFIGGEDLLVESLSGARFHDIKSSIDAKGAEYSQVVLYGFGDQYLDEFGQLSWHQVDNSFKRKFFFNKLYVAITRAQNELVIIDSADAIEKFWRQLLNIPNTITRWEVFEDVSEIMLINPESGLKDVQTSTPDEALSNAFLDMEQGIASKNRARLIVAKNVFLMLGRTTLASICDGHQHALNLQWKLAGDCFVKGDDLELASDAFFQGMHWNELKKETKSHPGNRAAARALIANLMNTGNWNSEEFTAAYAIRKELGEVLHQIDWYDQFTMVLIRFSNMIESREAKRELAYIIEGVTRNSDIDLLRILGQLYFDTKQFTHAIATWDKVLGNEKNPIFFPSYILASIEKAIDDRNVHDQLLWSGRRLRIETEVSELQKLSNTIIALEKDLGSKFDVFPTKSELYSTVYCALVVSDTIERLPEMAAIVERESLGETALDDLYTWLIHRSSDEKLAIFLKERWARQRWLLLCNKFGSSNEVDILTILNEEFASKVFPFEESNFPWTIDELIEIPEIPLSVQLTPPLHFQNLQVKGFKSFRNFSIANLGLFNLILGGNNSGKTSLLELLLFDPNPERCLYNLLYVAKLRENSLRLDHLDAFLPSIRNRDTDSRSIDFTIINGRRFWTFEIRNPHVGEIKIDHSQEESLVHYLTIDDKHGKQFTSSNSRERIRDLSNHKGISSIPFVPFGKGYSDGLSSAYYTNIWINRGLRQVFAEQMKLFIPQIVEINIDPDQELIMITEEVEGVERTSPLHEFGEGANKLFRILVQIFVAKDARLMIDEIDAGIHYSIFPKFWSVILQFAKRQNVQLFATTHNEECIRFFEEVLSEDTFEEYAYRQLCQ